MNATDTTTLVLALIANVLCVAVLTRMWSRSRRGRSAERTRHPSVRPPVAVELVPSPPWSRLCVTVAPTAPPVTIDIVSYRRANPAGPWDNEPIPSPISVEAGGRAELGATLPAGSAADVVVAWTAHHPTGDVQSSHLFRLPAEREVDDGVRPRAGALPVRVALLVGGLVVGSVLLVAASWLDRDDAVATEPSADAAREEPPSTVPPSVSTVPITAPAPTPTAATTVETSPSTSAPAGTQTSVPAAPSPTSTEPATVTSATGAVRSVVVEARVEPCRFGEDCLVVGFTLDGFTTSPQEYVCEFEDGSRFTFRFDSGGVDTACAGGAAGTSITVEVDGVRSATVTRSDVATR